MMQPTYIIQYYHGDCVMIIFLKIVPHIGDHLNTWMVGSTVVSFWFSLLVPIQYPSNKWRYQSNSTLCTCNSLIIVEYQSHVALNSILLQCFGCLYSLPSAGNLNQYSLLRNTCLSIQLYNSLINCISFYTFAFSYVATLS